MAASKRNLSDFSGSLSLGSEEEVDHFCVPCLTIGFKVNAHIYCVDCGEYLCRFCSDYHLRTKALRYHKLVDRDRVCKQPTTKDSEVCTEKCPKHKQEVIKYFCPQHENLGCHVCMIMNHKPCDVDYIPDKCADIANSEEYRRTMQQLDLKLQELNEITKTTKVRDQDIDKYYHNLLQEIIQFRKEINNELDRLQQKIQKEADKKKTEDKQIIQRILDGCNRLSSDIKKMKSTMKYYEKSGKYDEIYLKVKQAQAVLRSDKIKADDGLERTAQQFIFKCNNSFKNTLSKQDAFGNLCLTFVPTTPRRNMKTFHNITRKEPIYVRTKSDKEECLISGCAVSSSNKLVLADYSNNKLKVVNMYTKSVVAETTLDSKPAMLAVMSHDQIAVTMPEKREVLIMTYDDRLSTIKRIPVQGRCRGITHHHGQLYVVCINPLCVLILDEQGNVQNKISLKEKDFSEPHYFVVNEEFKLLYISDREKCCVVSVTFHGEVTAAYKHKDFLRPLGMLMLDDGSLLVCCTNGIIDHISGDLEQGQTVTDGLQEPFSLCYNHHLHEVYIGGKSNLLNVFIPERKHLKTDSESFDNLLIQSCHSGIEI